MISEGEGRRPGRESMLPTDGIISDDDDDDNNDDETDATFSCSSNNGTEDFECGGVPRSYIMLEQRPRLHPALMVQDGDAYLQNRVMQITSVEVWGLDLIIAEPLKPVHSPAL